jgi:hypothetical protein
MVLAAEKEKYFPNQGVFQSTCGILFLGTPHDSSWPSVIGKAIVNLTFWMRSSSSIIDALGYRSTELRALDRDFANVYPKGKQITCIYETKTLVYGILPVVSIY